ncbi:MAG TPA: glycosyltransferase family 4 protein [Candidatus Paceibacterota bacterium]
MKILIAAGLYPPEIGGPATYALLLETELPKRGIEVTVLPFGTVRHHPKVIRHLLYAWKLWRAQRGHDIIYALDSISVGVPALVVSKLSRKPFLIRLGGDYAWEQGRMRYGLTTTLDEYHANLHNRPLMVRVLAFIQSVVTRSAVRVIAPSAYLKSIIENWGVRPEMIEVIYSALYPLTVEKHREALRKELGYTDPTIVSAGRLVPWKGFAVLIAVIAELKKLYPEISLIIAGDGEERASLIETARVHGVTNHVRFVGSISKEVLGATIKAADVFVLNTAYEGLSHQLIEVMDLGTPVVTTPAGGNTELITNEVHGLLVAFNDKEAMVAAIRRLLEYPETRNRIVQSARARSKEFSEANMLERLEVVLRTIYDKRSA